MLSTLKIANSPFTEQQISQLQQSVGQLDPAQSAWLSGYMAGRLAVGSNELAVTPLLSAAPVTKEQSVLNVFYASQTGNGEGIAQALVTEARMAGLAVRARTLNELKPSMLKTYKHAVFIISTHGEGDQPPAECRHG